MKLPQLLCLVLALTACGRAANVGQVPQMSEPRQGGEFAAMTNPPLDIPVTSGRPEAAASLWAGSQNSLVGDRRAAARGDILTVVVEINDTAAMNNTSGRSRTANDKVGIPSLAGIPQRLDKALPEGASLSELAEMKSSSNFKGTGNIARNDKLSVRVAATVIDRLPNGVLHIQGTQEVRVNYEVRELTVSGFVRPQDISGDNEVAYDRMAGARLSYGGHGQISDVQQPRLGQQVADIVLPY